MRTAPELTWPFAGRGAELRQLDEWFANPTVGGVVLFGETGIGKSSLARHWLARPAPTFAPQVVRCGRGLADVPLGCMVPLLGDDRHVPDTGARLAAIERRVRLRHGRQSLLLVEDAQWIDPASAHLLRRLALEGATTLLVTVCTPGPTTPALSDLVKEDAVRSLDVPPLESDEVADLLTMALAGPIDPDLVATVSDVSEGNPLFVRELVTASLDSGAIRLDEVWGLARPLALSRLLTDLTAERLRTLSDHAGEALRLVVVAGTVDLEHLLALASPEAVAELEVAGLVVADDRAGTSRYRAGHHLVAEIVLARTPVVERTAIAARLADALEGLGRPGDRAFLDAVRWRVGSIAPPRSEDLQRAQSLAIESHDFALATECGRILWRRLGTPAEALSFGQALFAMHTRDSLLELEVVLTECQARTPPADPRLPELIGLRALNLGVGIGRIDQAADLVGGAMSAVANDAEADVLATSLGATLLYCGFPDRALDALSRLDLGRQPRGELHWCNALWMAGRLHDLREHLAATPEPRRKPWMLAAEAAALLYLGDLPAAMAKADESLSDVFVAAGKDTFSHLQSHLVLGWLSMVEGRSVDAAAQFETATAAVEGTGLAIVPLAHLAIASTHSGDLRTARQSLLSIETVMSALRHSTGGRQGLDAITLYAVTLARTWVAVAEGRGRAGGASLLRVAARVGERGERLNEAWLLHEATCLGYVQSTGARRLRALQAEIGGDLIPLWADHAHALATRDSDGLAAVADELLELGAVRDAVYAGWSSWVVADDDGDERRANVARSRLHDLASGTDWQPAFLPPPVEREALTRRELHVAQHAAEGLTSKEIAHALSLSTRTVDNNLQRVYAKLGLSGRRDLRGATLPDDDRLG